MHGDAAPGCASTEGAAAAAATGGCSSRAAERGSPFFLSALPSRDHPPSACLPAVAENIRHYMAERLGVPADEVAEMCADLYLK